MCLANVLFSTRMGNGSWVHGTGRHALLLLVSLRVMGCTTTPGAPQEAETFGFLPSGTAIWAGGPWPAIQPSEDVDAVIDQLCPQIMKLPRATLQDYGQEYCGALYTVGDGRYYASHPSPLGSREPLGPQRRKACYPPRAVRDARGRATLIADFHSHPWAPSSMSPRDREARNQLWLIRIQFDTRCTIQKLVPHLDEDRPGELFVREGARWRRIGLILQDDKASGRVTALSDE